MKAPKQAKLRLEEAVKFLKTREEKEAGIINQNSNSSRENLSFTKIPFCFLIDELFEKN